MIGQAVVVGMSVHDAVKLLMRRDDRPGGFLGPFKLRPNWYLGIDGKYMQMQTSSEYLKTKYVTANSYFALVRYEKSVDFYVKRLLPLFDNFASGLLYVQCRDLSVGARENLFRLPSDIWRGPWHIALADGDAILTTLDGLGNEYGKYRLLEIEPATIDFEIRELHTAERAALPAVVADNPPSPQITELAYVSEADPGLSKRPKQKRGALGKFEWDALHEALISECFLEYSFPLKRGEQAKIEAWALSWLRKHDLAVKSGGEPGEITIRRKVKKAIDAYTLAAGRLPDEALAVGS